MPLLVQVLYAGVVVVISVSVVILSMSVGVMMPSGYVVKVVGPSSHGQGTQVVMVIVTPFWT